jgi:hypothetical protein
MGELNEPIVVVDGGLSLRLPENDTLFPLIGQLTVRWQPTFGIEFEGEADLPLMAELPECALVFQDPLAEAKAFITQSNVGIGMRSIRGVMQRGADLARPGADAIDRLTFYLVDFPQYSGVLIRRSMADAMKLFRGRIQVTTPEMTLVIDAITEHEDLQKDFDRLGGFFLSHVGEIRFGTPITHEAAKSTLECISLFIAFLRGAWSGPILPQGFAGSDLVWQQFANWRIDEPRKAATWLPELSPLDLTELFDNFRSSCESAVWSEPLRTALHWYLSANSSRAPRESQIVLSQIALELLANLELVEILGTSKPKPFAELAAAERIRRILNHLRIPITVPAHFPELASLLDAERPDGPGIIAYLRNRLVHSAVNSRRALTSVTSIQWWQASELAVGYVELAILALHGYRGKYSLRGWREYKGPNEVDVPWVGT